MRKSIKTITKLLTVTLLLGVALAVSLGNVNAASIGFTEEGNGIFTNIDLLTYRTDTGLAIGFLPANLIPPGAPYDVDFILQGRVGSFALNGNPVTDSAVDGIILNSKEMTFTTRFTETVVSQVVSGAGLKSSFRAGENTSAFFNMYLDTTPDADPNNVSGYTDGVNVLTGHLLSLTSVFESPAPGILGTGSFDVRFKIDSFDSLYFDFVPDSLLFRFVTTGTLNQPSQYTPAVMWDTTLTGAGVNPQLLKFDGSTNFNVVPEPSTIFLLGAGLLGLGAFARRKKS